MIPFLISLLCVGVIVFLVWWLIFETEGVYLGRGVVIWLYDIYATRYDAIKENHDDDEHHLLAIPLMTTVYPYTDPLVLDVATGTGRIPLALNTHAEFDGHVIGVDLSLKMLNEAARKLNAVGLDDNVTLIHQDADKLPFEDDIFDIVTCMESLEFMMQPDDVLRECIRVLRPGGVLLITQRLNMKLMPGKIRSQSELETLLSEYGIEGIEFHRWQMDYTKVWGQKSGNIPYSGVKLLEEILICPECGDCMIEKDDVWHCENCVKSAPVLENGILDLHNLR